MIHEMHEMLAEVRLRLQSVRVGWAQAACWLVWAAIAGVMLWEGWYGAWSWAVIALAGVVTAAFWRDRAAAAASDPHWIAQRIEARHPELGTALLAALEQAPTPRFRRLSFLQSAVIDRAVAHGRAANWAADVPLGKVILARLANLGSAAVFVAMCVLLFQHKDAEARIAPNLPEQAAVAPAADFDLKVEPGNAEIERGTTLLVVAHFGRTVPAEVELVAAPATDPEQPAAESTLLMTRSLDDPQFVGRVASVGSDLTYHVTYAGNKSDEYRITVFDYPALERTDAELNYPEYTGLEPKRIEDVRRVTAVEGTTLGLEFRLNKEIADARLVDRDGEEIVLQRTDAEEPILATELELTHSHRFKLHLKDDAGRENKLPADIVVSVTPNRPVQLKATHPARDVRVSPVEELDVAATATDDFGLVRHGVSFATGGDPTQEVVLFERDANSSAQPEKKATLTHLIDFEALAAEPDQLLSYYFWAEDRGPDGAIRRTMSDMYFAEVRPFEEIFRQGEQPTEQQLREQQQQQQQGEGQQNADRAEELAELQKQIVSAVWTLIRRETAAEPSATFVDDAEVIKQSQQQAVTQLEELAAELTDDQSLAHVDEAREQMNEVLTDLGVATAGPSISPLNGALSSAQSAYQTLLKLRAREFNLIEGNPQQQSGQAGGTTSGPGSRSQRQLNQLELDAEQNRYETQSRALDSQNQAAADESAVAESREMLDRLRELARRQEDLNDRVREMQAELEAAADPAEREEIERELKRLREQQREILRDTDQLQNEMEGSEQSEQLSDARQQLEQTRERVQQASEALAEGELGQALTEGTRAERELNNLRDDFRRRTADRFNEELTQMQQDARDLETRQQGLAQALAEENSAENRTLRDSGRREELIDQLTQQQEDFNQLLEDVQETVEEAEEPEPLLARQLFETAQQALDTQVEESLDVTRQLLEVGVTGEANETLQRANRGIEQLREGIEQAAESVLGDSTEALRRAERELRDLSEQLNQEIADAQGAGQSADNPPGEQPGRGGNQPNEPNEEAEQQGNQPGQGETSPGEGQGRGGGQPREPNEDGQQRGNQPGQDGQPDENETPPGEGQGRSGGQGDEPNSDAEQNPVGGGRPNVEEPGDQQARQQRVGGNDNPGSLAEWLGGFTPPTGPITGENFREWNDRLRNVEDLLDDAELRAEAGRIRDRAEAARAEFRRHAREPDWTKLTDMVAEPLAELRKQIEEEIRREQSPDAIAPVDRDPVPTEFTERVRLYYERLGSGE